MIKLIIKSELKKIFSKKVNKILIIICVILSVLFSCFAIGSTRYVDEKGQVHTDISSSRKLATNKNKWKGLLTENQISNMIKIEQELTKKYPNEIPDTEFGKKAQSYDDIKSFVTTILNPDSEYDEMAFKELLNNNKNESIYNIYQNNIQKVIKEYGTTSQKQTFLKKQYQKIKELKKSINN